MSFGARAWPRSELTNGLSPNYIGTFGIHPKIYPAKLVESESPRAESAASHPAARTAPYSRAGAAAAPQTPSP